MLANMKWLANKHFSFSCVHPLLKCDATIDAGVENSWLVCCTAAETLILHIHHRLLPPSARQQELRNPQHNSDSLVHSKINIFHRSLSRKQFINKRRLSSQDLLLALKHVSAVFFCGAVCSRRWYGRRKTEKRRTFTILMGSHKNIKEGAMGSRSCRSCMASHH